MNFSQLFINKHLAAIFFCVLCMNFVGLPVTHAQSSCSWLNIQPVINGLELEEGDWVADIGSRQGTYLNQIAEVIGNEGHIFAVDISPDGFDGLHQHMDSWDYHNISTVYSVPDNPLLPRSSFDAIMMRNAYHEFTDPTGMLEHFKASLKPGGQLAILDTMDDDYRDKSRDVQYENHRLNIDYAIEDLTSTGFEIAIKERKLRHYQNDESQPYTWLIIATPTSR